MLPRTLRQISGFVALASVLLLNGCALALYGQSHISGDNLPLRLPVLDPGSTREQVVAVLGEPSRPPSGQGEKLQWTEVIYPRGCRMYVLLFIPLGRPSRVVRQVEADFDGGRLVRADVSYLDHRRTVTHSESLLRTAPVSAQTPGSP